jgi:predicted negative regulator of RcsB-dependent stress response
MSRREARYPRSGELIDRLVRSVAAAKGWSMRQTMRYIGERTHFSPDMIHRWRQGHYCPAPETLEILIRIGREDAGLPREWGESLLNSVHYANATNLVNQVWGPRMVRSIPCNLPPRDCTDLIGRQAEVARLLELLSPQHAAPLITVDGIGGVGKTALVLDVAYSCWKVSTGEEVGARIPSFDAIVFVSAKQQYLTPDGILLGKDAKRTLRDIIREIASTLNRPEITRAIPQEQAERVYKALAQQTTLLIVDNLETMEDRQEILAFLYNLPASVKVIITSRERTYVFSPIRLEQLAQEAALNLIEKEAQEKDAEINSEQAFDLYRHIGGIPAALVYAVGQIASGYSLKTVLEKIPQAGSDVARFCFEGSLAPLRGQPAHRLLMAIAMFHRPPLRSAIASTAGLVADQTAVEDGLALLQRLSLVKQQEGRYALLSLTREYALSELAAQPSFEKEARRRWIEWYRDFAEEFGEKDWDDWIIRYDKIEEEWENLLAVFDWCAVHEQYKNVQFFWQERQMVRFSHIYGYWDDRLFWLGWLIQGAKKRGDWAQAVKAMVDLAFTYTLMHRFEEADKLLQQAWAMHEQADLRVQLIVMQKIANLRVQQGEYGEALSWLDRAKILLDTLIADEKCKPTLDEHECDRRITDFQSNRGFCFFKKRDYDQAEICYREVIKLAQPIGWQRVVIYAQNHLAHIAIMQDKLDEAEALLKTSLPVDKDARLAAFHKQTRAYFYQKKGKVDEACRLAKEAFEAYERLGMKREAQEAGELLRTLQG